MKYKQNKYDDIKVFAFNKFKEMGPKRTLPRLRGILLALDPAAPCLGTIKNWSRQDNWFSRAGQHDAAVRERLNRAAEAEILETLPHSEAGVMIQEADLMRLKVGVFNAKVEFSRAARNFLRIVNDWSENANYQNQKEMRTCRDIRTLLDGAAEAVRMVEVLEGRVSDRRAEEKTVTAEDNRAKAKERANELVAQCASIATKLESRLSTDEVH